MKAAAALLACLLAASPARAGSTNERVLEMPKFGTMTTYGDTSAPAHVAIFVSGDGGWNQGVVDMARALADDGTLVAGLDITQYLRSLAHGHETCSDFAVDFEALSQSLQKRLALPAYATPVLVGYSSGATLVYATLVQAPPNTFPGAISLGFCPDLPLPKAPCRRGGLQFESPPKPGKPFVFAPAGKLESPWIVLQGQIDRVCHPKSTETFVKQVGRAELVSLPNVGHGFSVPAHWLPQLRASFVELTTHAPPVGGRLPETGPADALADLPLVELPPTAASGDLLAVVISGDGGWASLDREVGGALAARGVAVVGLDSLRYFWKERTPDEAGKALERILNHYLNAWRRKRILLIGFSRGADVLPFMASRLSPSMRSRVALVTLLGPAREASFEIHLTDWLPGSVAPESRPILPEAQNLRGQQILCVYGAAEADSLCPTLPKDSAIVDKRPGGHHFGGEYEEIVERILKIAGVEERPR